MEKNEIKDEHTPEYTETTFLTAEDLMSAKTWTIGPITGTEPEISYSDVDIDIKEPLKLTSEDLIRRRETYPYYSYSQSYRPNDINYTNVLIMGWIPVNSATKDASNLPELKDGLFTKLWGTDKWGSCMTYKRSDTVLLSCRFKGEPYVTTGRYIQDTPDGECHWKPDNCPAKFHESIVEAWMPYPNHYEEPAMVNITI